MTDLSELGKHNIHNTSLFSLNGSNTLARIINIHDGDTITCILPCFNNYYKFNIRLNGIDTCELKSTDPILKEKALSAKKRLFQYISDVPYTSTTNIIDFFDKHIVFVWLECKNFDKYGRLLADVFKVNIGCADGDLKLQPSLSDLLLKEKLAYEYHGERKLTEQEIKDLFIEEENNHCLQ